METGEQKNVIEKIKKTAGELEPKLTAIRRELH